MPDRPHLEAGARALALHFRMRDLSVMRKAAGVVLDAAVPELQAELEACPLHDDAQHPGWSRYVAANLAVSLSVIPDTGDWYWAVRSWCERNRGDMQPNPNPVVTRAERAEAELEQARELLRRFAPYKHDTGCPVHIMHDWYYEGLEGGTVHREEASLPVPRCCDCGFDAAREALAGSSKGRERE